MPSAPSPDQGSPPSRLLERALAPVAAALGLEIVTVEWSGGTGARLARIFIDGEGGVDLDTCARVSRVISTALDALSAGASSTDPEAVAAAAAAFDHLSPAEFVACGDLLARAYTLEVSSPGIERPLAKRKDYERFLGRRVTVRTWQGHPPESAQKVFHGRIEAVACEPGREDDPWAARISVRADDPIVSGGERPLFEFTLDQIRRAHLVWEQ